MDEPYIGVARVPPTAPVRDEPGPPLPPPRSRPFVWVIAILSCGVILVATGILFGWAIRTAPGPTAPGAAASAAAAAKKPSPSSKRASPQAVTQKYLDALAAGDAAAGDAQVCSLLRGKAPNDLNLPFS